MQDKVGGDFYYQGRDGGSILIDYFSKIIDFKDNVSSKHLSSFSNNF